MLLSRGLPAALAVLESVRQEIVAEARRIGALNQPALLDAARRILARHEPVLARTLRDATLTAWLSAAKDTAAPADLPKLPGPPARGNLLPAPPGAEPVVRFPQIESAAKWLADKSILRPGEFLTLDQDARRAAFTVARINSVKSLERIRNALASDITRGGTLKEFREEIAADVGEALSPAQVETLYRTQVGAAYAAGQKAILDHPLVGDEFPYVEYSATHDSRTRPEHASLERRGIQGTAIYRSDDPVIRRFWAPWDWNCRCVMIPLTLEDAAAKGVKEAQKWLETGIPPSAPAFVEMPPFAPPEGFFPVGNRIVAVV